MRTTVAEKEKEKERVTWQTAVARGGQLSPAADSCRPQWRGSKEDDNKGGGGGDGRHRRSGHQSRDNRDDSDDGDGDDNDPTEHL